MIDGLDCNEIYEQADGGRSNMKDGNGNIGIGEWAEKVVADIRRFADHWNEHREAGNPAYPERMSRDKWDKRFRLLSDAPKMKTKALEMLSGEDNLYVAFFQAWEMAEGDRGCYSCHAPHDCRCERQMECAKKHDETPVCECYRDTLESLAEKIRNAKDEDRENE